MPKSKKNIKVRDLKPNKDAKGGGGFKPTGANQGTGKGESGANMGPNQGTNMGANQGNNMGANF
jgi:hypothetical protein